MTEDPAAGANTVEPRPHVCIDGLAPQQQVDLLLAALARANDPPTVFRHGKRPVRIRRQSDGYAWRQPLGWIDLRSEIVARMTLVHRSVDTGTGEPIEVSYWPPRVLVETLLRQWLERLEVHHG
jgi:hypothetical protein